MTQRPQRAVPVRNLESLPLNQVRAHGGRGEIGFSRVFEGSTFEGPWNFVDLAVLPPGSSIGRHRHGADEELYLVLSGSGVMIRDGEEFAVRSGSVIVNRRGGEHELRNDGAEPLRLFVVEIAITDGERGP